MSITPTSPGVYVTEVLSGTRTVTGVSTSITAFVGCASRGPADKPVSVNSLADFTRAFGPLRRDSGLGYAVSDFYRNGGGPAFVVRVVGDGADSAALTVGGIQLKAIGPGAWGNDITAMVDYPPAEEAKEIAPSQGFTENDGGLFFNLTIAYKKDVEKEVYRNLTVVDGPRRVDRVLSSSRLVTASLDDQLPASRPTKGDYVVTSIGKDGEHPEATHFLPDTGRGGVYALNDVDLVNLIVIPPLTPDLSVPPEVWAKALAYAKERRAFLLVDPPPGKRHDEVQAWLTGDAGLVGLNARNGAVYYPHIRVADPLRGGSVVNRPASATIAGLYARTDATRGVWKAPAGTDAGILGALGPTDILTDHQNGEINQVGINAIRSFRDTGTVVWGARTLRGADGLSDEYKYVPVRRLALFIEESLYRGTQWVVFEPNDEPLWSQIRVSIGAFMQDLFRKRAFQGKSPREAYFVNCSADTTTQYDIDRGIVNVEVGFAPLKPAEFVMISIQQKMAAQE